ncbi:MAG: 3'-5' exonuclease [Clostridia bacterium]|nr:3'-5' exonuclease [Clostridia bacterium]
MIICLDTETTGLYPGEICQLSYVCINKGVVTAKNFFFAVDHVEYGAYLVHGFSVEKLLELSKGKTFAQQISEIQNDFDKASFLVAHNVNFDFSFLSKEFERCGRIFYCKDSFCTMKKSLPICKIPRANHRGYKYPKLSELCAFLGITDTQIQLATRTLFGKEVGYHDARFDATAVYLAVEKGINQLPEYALLKEHL